ncbi:unnamed protein product [Arabis nemorensis]|uniref:nucleoside-diphosphate kinase n=1 Tax=Arabis nemorensis TaxID=586526 RepID=A0A565B4Z3_9BRAS|nr:unnamed protein product [Arabis nemorensis]
MEPIFILIKPNGVQAGLVRFPSPTVSRYDLCSDKLDFCRIVSVFMSRVFRLDEDSVFFCNSGLKMITLDRPFAEKHYQHSSAEPFFPHLVNYISSGPVVAMILEGEERTLFRVEKRSLERQFLVMTWTLTLAVESANKEIALWFPEGRPVKLHSDVARPKARDIGRISVTRFDTGIPREDVESALREHFASCGKITDVYIRKGSSVAYIYFVGEGAVDKALELSGSDVGGWNVCAEAYPFWDNNGTMFTVLGFDPSLLDSEIERALREHFSSCGVVTEVTIFKKRASVALELSGSKLVRCLSRPPRYTVHDRRGPPFDSRTRINLVVGGLEIVEHEYHYLKKMMNELFQPAGAAAGSNYFLFVIQISDKEKAN